MYCRDCAYDLRGSCDGGVCPECGRGFCVGDEGSYDLVAGGGSWSVERKALFCKRYGREVKIHFCVFVVLCLFRWFYYERFVAFPEVIADGLIGLLGLYCAYAMFWGVIGIARSLFRRTGLRFRYLLYYPVWFGMILFLMNEGYGREAWRRRHTIGHTAYLYKHCLKESVYRYGLPVSWRYDEVTDWMEREAKAGGNWGEEDHDIEKLKMFKIKFLSVDDEFVRYRYLGDGFDDGGLRDDFDFSIGLYDLKKWAVYGEKKRGVK